MATFHQSHATNQQLIALLDEFPDTCDSEFDDSHEELERQFAELRLTFDHN